MHSALSKSLSFLLLAGVSCVFGCNGANEGGTEAEQLEAEREEVADAEQELESAQENVAEQKEELQDAKENLTEQIREHEEAEDAIGDAQRQLQKEQADLEAERQDAEPVLPVEPE